MKKLLLKVDTTKGTFTDWAGAPYDSVALVNGDTVLFCVHFEESLTSTPTALSLAGALGLRCILKSARTSAGTEWSFQDSYNGGNYVACEVLASGYVTWAVSVSSAALTTSLGTSEYTDGYLEFAYLDASNYPQTLIQIPLRVYQQLDTGAVGVPPPTSPTYLTAVEIAAAYVAKATFDANTILKADADDTPEALTVAEQTLVGRITAGEITALTQAQVRTLLLQPDLSVNAPGSLTAVDGRQWVWVTILAGGTVTLPAANAQARCEFLIVNIGATGTITIAPAGADTINGAAASLTIVGRWGCFHLKTDGTSNWVCPNMLMP